MKRLESFWTGVKIILIPIAFAGLVFLQDAYSQDRDVDEVWLNFVIANEDHLDDLDYFQPGDSLKLPSGTPYLATARDTLGLYGIASDIIAASRQAEKKDNVDDDVFPGLKNSLGSVATVAASTDGSILPWWFLLLGFPALAFLFRGRFSPHGGSSRNYVVSNGGIVIDGTDDHFGLLNLQHSINHGLRSFGEDLIQTDGNGRLFVDVDLICGNGLVRALDTRGYSFTPEETVDIQPWGTALRGKNTTEVVRGRLTGLVKADGRDGVRTTFSRKTTVYRIYLESDEGQSDRLFVEKLPTITIVARGVARGPWTS